MVNKLKEVRFFKGVSQWELALATGRSQSLISLIERGFVSPTDEDKKKIAKALRLKLDEVFPEVNHGSSSES